MSVSAAPAVLTFWFDEVGKDRWFAKNAGLDAEIARRFATLRDDVVASRAQGWRHSVETLTAAVLLLDQFSRNIHRDGPKAFEADPLALELASIALDNGWSHDAPTDWRQFLLMPLMHSEDPAIQGRSVAEFTRLGDPLNIDFALKHRDQIARFGRFPGRNKALGRVSTAEEREAITTGAVF